MKSKKKFYEKKHHSMRNKIMLASGVALAMAGTWMSMRMIRRHSHYDEEQDIC